MTNIEPDARLAAYYCSCGKEGLAPGWDWHCTTCHRDFTRIANDGARVGDSAAFHEHVCVPLPARRATAKRA